ncbi:MAG: hypothetical protein GY754_25920 [bacterium]|nr:hypothetical protein [bacterium]
MKKTLNLCTFSMLIVLFFALTGCEAGLSTSSDSSEDSDSKFSFSQMYDKVAAIEAQNTAIKNELSNRGDNDSNTDTVIASMQASIAAPSIPEGWVECNGQEINDSESIYDGQTAPSLNNGGRFLRGNTTSGIFQSDQFQGHFHQAGMGNIGTSGGAHGISDTTKGTSSVQNNYTWFANTIVTNNLHSGSIYLIYDAYLLFI